MLVKGSRLGKNKKRVLHVKPYTLVAYFCNHLSDDYVELSDRYVYLSGIYVDRSAHYVDWSEKYNPN